MKTLITTAELAEFCAHAKHFPFVTVDTEFLRERTYYAQLCLVQLAVPGEDDEEDAVLVDALADGLVLDPLYALFRDPNVVKVFHAARQDLEIFFHASGEIPDPVFDTQVAAMVCGFGEQVGYETLARRIAGGKIDKSSRFTDWSRRPLSPKQQRYALDDVTHLRDIYVALSEQLSSTGRASWVEQEMAVLKAPETYHVVPRQAWQRVKTRSNSRRFLAIVRELAELRETLAQSRDVPRARIFKDDAMLEIAANRPTSMEALNGLRLMQKEARKAELREAILQAVARAVALPDDALPVVEIVPDRKSGNEAVIELLRVLLKARAEAAGVAQRLIANAADLDTLAAEDKPDVAATTGWRHELFGADALRLKRGEIGLTISGKGVEIFELATIGEAVA